MAETKWEDGEHLSRAWVGDELAPVAWVLQASDGAALIMNNQNGNEFLAMNRRAEGRDAVKAAAEQALREMHDALVAHFAPVLRWTRVVDDDGERDEAIVDKLRLKAGHYGWSVRRASDDMVIEFGIVGGDFGLPLDDGIGAGRDRCAESLRSLGVVFRTEGE